MIKPNTVIWRNHKIVGYCTMSGHIRDMLNETQMSFYFGVDKLEGATFSWEEHVDISKIESEVK